MRKKVIAVLLAVSALALTGCNKRVEMDMTTLKADELNKKVSEIIAEPQNYNGIYMKITGQSQTMRDPILKQDYHVCLTTYGEGKEPQGIEYVLMDDKYPLDGDLVTVSGIFTTYEGKKGEIDVIYSELREATVEAASKAVK